MHRRRLLEAATGALAAAFAGCLRGSANAPGETAPGPGGNASTDSETTDPGDGTGNVRVRVVVENHDDRAHTVTVEAARVVTPACRYATPACGRPSTRTVALDRAFGLGAGDRRVLPPAEMRVESEGDAVDAYRVRVGTKAGASGDLLGLESGAASVVGRSAASDYPWRVAVDAYVVHAEVAAGGDVRVSLRAPVT